MAAGSTRAPAAAGLPLRGLAMILIAVAVMLGLWGLYSLTQDDADNSSSSAAGETTSSAPQVSTDQSGANTAVPAPSPAGSPTPSAPAPASAPATPPGGVLPPAASPADTKVNVVNNSTHPGLAESVYRQLDAEGLQVGEHGNLPGERVTLTETTVFYREGDAASEAAARELAERIAATNGVPAVAKPNISELPAEMTAPGNITLALIGDVVI